MTDRIYPSRPLVGVGGIVFDGEGRVLIIRRGAEPQRGRWSVPGGLLDVGESLEEGVRREVLEETCLEVEVGPLVTTFDRIERDHRGRVRYHYVLVDFLCRAPRGAVPEASSDALEARFIDPACLADFDMTPMTPKVIGMALRVRADQSEDWSPSSPSW